MHQCWFISWRLVSALEYSWCGCFLSRVKRASRLRLISLPRPRCGTSLPSPLWLSAAPPSTHFIAPGIPHAVAPKGHCWLMRLCMYACMCVCVLNTWYIPDRGHLPTLYHFQSVSLCVTSPSASLIFLFFCPPSCCCLTLQLLSRSGASAVFTTPSSTNITVMLILTGCSLACFWLLFLLFKAPLVKLSVALCRWTPANSLNSAPACMQPVSVLGRVWFQRFCAGSWAHTLFTAAVSLARLRSALHREWQSAQWTIQHILPINPRWRSH